MRVEKLKNFLAVHLSFMNPAARVGARTEPRFPYRVVTLCRTEDAAPVEHLIQQQLLDTCIVRAQRSETVGARCLTRIEVEMLCSIDERAGVVQLVTRLGLEQSVRSVCWESMPYRLTV